MFVGYDCGESQYFEKVDTKNNIIPCGDVSAYQLYPEFNWVYNKLELCKTQNIEANPHGVSPKHLPVFSKPIINLFGMGIGRKLLYDPGHPGYIAGHFWMPVLTGVHLSTDFVVVDGISKWNHTFKGYKNSNGEFTYWEYIGGKYESIIEHHRTWILKHLKGFTGIVNIESIEDKIIECHLRMTPQFVDLYGEGWLESVVDLYDKGFWRYENKLTAGFSVPLWTTKAGIYLINQEDLEKLREKVSSIQIFFNSDCEVNESICHQDHFRLAIINDFDKENAFNVLEELRELIILTG